MNKAVTNLVCFASCFFACTIITFFLPPKLQDNKAPSVPLRCADVGAEGCVCPVTLWGVTFGESINLDGLELAGEKDLGHKYLNVMRFKFRPKDKSCPFNVFIIDVTPVDHVVWGIEAKIDVNLFPSIDDSRKAWDDCKKYIQQKMHIVDPVMEDGPDYLCMMGSDRGSNVSLYWGRRSALEFGMGNANLTDKAFSEASKIEKDFDMEREFSSNLKKFQSVKIPVAKNPDALRNDTEKVSGAQEIASEIKNIETKISDAQSDLAKYKALCASYGLRNCAYYNGVFESYEKARNDNAICSIYEKYFKHGIKGVVIRNQDYIQCVERKYIEPFESFARNNDKVKRMNEQYKFASDPKSSFYNKKLAKDLKQRMQDEYERYKENKQGKILADLTESVKEMYASMVTGVADEIEAKIDGLKIRMNELMNRQGETTKRHDDPTYGGRRRRRTRTVDD